VIPVTYDVASKTATFHPAAALSPSTTYTATIKGIGANPATDLIGNALAGDPALPLVANNYVWTFRTGIVPDTARPRVTDTVPDTTIPGPTLGVSTTTAITAAFNEDMLPESFTAATFTVTGPGGTPVPGAAIPVTYAVGSKTATFHPLASLSPSTTYTATIKGTGAHPATDMAGNALAGNPALPLVAHDYVWTFTTGLTPDATLPRVTATVPGTTSPGPTPGVSTDTLIFAVFNEDMLPESITTSFDTFTLTGPGTTPVAALSAATYDVPSRTATFHLLAAALTPGTTYTATIKGTGANPATDMAGNALAGVSTSSSANDYVWRFTTASVPDTARPIVTGTVPLTTPGGPTLGVPTDTAITATFNEDMFPPSITASYETFTLTGPGTTPVPTLSAATYDFLSKTATFHPFIGSAYPRRHALYRQDQRDRRQPGHGHRRQCAGRYRQSTRPAWE